MTDEQLTPPALTRVTRKDVLACPVREMWSFFEEVERGREGKQPNRLTKGQSFQQFNKSIDIHF